MSLLELFCHVDDFWKAFAPVRKICKVELVSWIETFPANGKRLKKPNFIERVQNVGAGE